MERRSISVVMPTYNRGGLIERAIRSVLEQTLPISELVIVDDGSTDSTVSVVETLAREDSRIILLKQEQTGAPAARNAGIAAATGALLAFQDSDDAWEPTFIEELEKLHSRPGIVAFSSMMTLRPDGSCYVEFPHRIVDVASVLAATNCVSTQSVLMDASLLRGLGFDESLPRLQDWDLWLTLLGSAEFVHCPRPLVKQYIQDDSITSGQANLYLALRVITRKHRRVMMRRPLRFVRLWVAARYHVFKGTWI